MGRALVCMSMKSDSLTANSWSKSKKTAPVSTSALASSTGQHCQGDEGVKDQLDWSTQDRLQVLNEVVLLTSKHMVCCETDTFQRGVDVSSYPCKSLIESI
uniref:Uncharacterized protein n=1 Tax=Romanomermis culicivorax TaxID=13658 RepID=A0A915IRS4_ROMCU